MSDDGIVLKWPSEDVRALRAQMERGRRELGISIPTSLRWAAKAFLQSMAKSTKIAPKYRAYKEIGITRTKRNKVYEIDTKYQTPRRKGKSTRASWQGPWRKQLIYAPNESSLKRRPAVMIAMRGLAAQAWLECGARGRMKITKAEAGGSRGAKNKRIMRKAARRWVEFRAYMRGPNPRIEIGNNLRYAVSALTGGEATVESAMSRAAAGMAHRITETIKRKMGAR